MFAVLVHPVRPFHALHAPIVAREGEDCREGGTDRRRLGGDRLHCRSFCR